MLLWQHMNELRRSTLSDETIASSGIHSVEDPREIERILHWRPSDRDYGPAMCLPFFDLNGSVNCYVRVKLDRPREGRGKYESPWGSPNRAYFPPDAISTINTPGADIGFGEGEKKILCATQASCPSIGLMGSWGWQQRRKKDSKGIPVGPRILTPELDAVDWHRRVWIAHDTDPTLSSGVLQGFCELARVLTDHGAKVFFVCLPTVTRRITDGLPDKMGIDDFVMATSAGSLRDLVDQAMTSRTVVSIGDYRENQKDKRREIEPGTVYMDRSQTGTGKTEADIEAAVKWQSSLFVVQSHAQGKEIVRRIRKLDHKAERYPKFGEVINPDAPKEEQVKNCRNLDIAEEALRYGLPPNRAVCPRCPFKVDCDYQEDLKAAEAASHAVGTHKRASYTLGSMAKDREFVSIQEDLINLLRPVFTARHGFAEVKQIAILLQKPYTFGEIVKNVEFYRMMELNANVFQEALHCKRITNLGPDLKCASPTHTTYPNLLELIMQQRETEIRESALTMVLEATAGHLLNVIAKPVKPGEPGIILAIKKVDLPQSAAISLCDASASTNHIERIIDRPISDVTPKVTIARLQQVIQFPVDVKKLTSTTKFLGLLRGLMIEKFPDCRRLGLMTHKKFLQHVTGQDSKGKPLSDGEPMLEEQLRKRISKLGCFFGTESRGSNIWAEDCDLLVVMGTPRPNPEAVRQRLMQLDDVKAACRDRCWMNSAATVGRHQGGYYWSAETISGRRRTIRTASCADHDWKEAFESICHAELMQCIGRARSILETGIPCVVMSCDPTGAPMADEGDDLMPMTEDEMAVYETLRANGPLRTGELLRKSGIVQAWPVGLAEPRLANCKRGRFAVQRLTRRGLIEQAGKGKAVTWRLVGDRCES